MKIYCFIDSLGSGGAQRQLVALGIGLKRRGHEIRFLMYHEDDHYIDILKKNDMTYIIIRERSYIKRFIKVREILRAGWQDVVLAFLESPSFYAEMATLPDRKWGLVVSERLADPNMNKNAGLLLRQFHRFADVVVSNSHTNRIMLERLFPFIIKKLYTIYNTVDMLRFRPILSDKKSDLSEISDEFSLVVIASYQKKKNMLNLAKALKIIYEKGDCRQIVVHWYGAMPCGPEAYDEVKKYLEENKLVDYYYLHPAVKNVEKEMRLADAVGLFSFYEGLPNVVCEGMACAKPILMSRVCDADNLVYDGKNGFLCDPESPKDIAEKILHIASLSKEEQIQMGKESRRIAEELFAEENIISQYEKLMISSYMKIKGEKIENWPPQVPLSAYETIKSWQVK